MKRLLLIPLLALTVQAGTGYYLSSQPHWPPLPYNPAPAAPAVPNGDGTYTVEDTDWGAFLLLSTTGTEGAMQAMTAVMPPGFDNTTNTVEGSNLVFTVKGRVCPHGYTPYTWWAKDKATGEVKTWWPWTGTRQINNGDLIYSKWPDACTNHGPATWDLVDMSMLKLYPAAYSSLNTTSTYTIQAAPGSPNQVLDRKGTCWMTNQTMWTEVVCTNCTWWTADFPCTNGVTIWQTNFPDIPIVFVPPPLPVPYVLWPVNPTGPIGLPGGESIPYPTSWPPLPNPNIPIWIQGSTTIFGQLCDQWEARLEAKRKYDPSTQDLDHLVPMALHTWGPWTPFNCGCNNTNFNTLGYSPHPGLYFVQGKPGTTWAVYGSTNGVNWMQDTNLCAYGGSGTNFLSTFTLNAYGTNWFEPSIDESDSMIFRLEKVN